MSNTSGTKAQPDVGTLNVEVVSKADTKVVLDIDDAPFLLDEEETKTPPQDRLPAETSPEDEAAVAAARKKKRIQLIGGGLAALFVVCAAFWWFALRTPPPATTVEPEVIVVPTPPAATLPQDYSIEFAPFWVELPDGKGGVVFLLCKFTAISKTASLTEEARGKMTVLRDAVYFYLKNKPYEFLLDPANAPTIKEDLGSVLSGYLAGGKIEDMLFESYIGK